MSKIDFQKDKDYYRDILREYSVIELSYIDDFKLKKKRDVFATVLNLELKKRVLMLNFEVLRIKD